MNRLPSPVGACNWSKEVPGYVILTDQCLTHTSGNKSRNFLIQYRYDWDGVALDMLADLKHNREVAQKLTGLERMKWTYSGLAMQLVGWLGLPNMKMHQRNAFLPTWHYQMCRPGEYGPGEFALWDMKDAYWHIATRLPSPYVTGMVLKGTEVEVEEGDSSGGSLLTTARWQEFLAQPWTKSFKVRFIGTNAAGWSLDNGPIGTVYRFHHGEREALPDRSGPLQALALICVRICYELCQMAAEEVDDLGETALYANSDAVIRYEDGNGAPRIWRELEIPCRCKARGYYADIYHIGSWNVGGTYTGTYAGDVRAGLNLAGEEKRGRRVKPSAYKILKTGKELEWQRKYNLGTRRNLRALEEREQRKASKSRASATSAAPRAGSTQMHQVSLISGFEP